jgi:hypothetical protein
MTIKPYLCTKLPIWSPKYDTEGEMWEVWILASKVYHATPTIIIEFTKAKHLMGQRFCIRRQDVEHCPLGSNGKAPVFKVPFDKLESYDTQAEILETALSIF